MRLDPLLAVRGDPTAGLSVIGRLRHGMSARAAGLGVGLQPLLVNDVEHCEAGGHTRCATAPYA